MKEEQGYKVYTADDEMPDCGRCIRVDGPDEFCCRQCGPDKGWNGYERREKMEEGRRKGRHSYWDGKEKRAAEALSHTKNMQESYGKEIRICTENTRYYEGKDLQGVLGREGTGGAGIAVRDMDSVSAVMAVAGKYGKSAVLNFSSYKEPGGGYIAGSSAQEECLCAESFLYNVLKEKVPDFYEKNRKDLNRALYRNKALYLPDVVFTRGGKAVKCDVITCAAPNAAAVRRYGNASEKEIDRALRERIFFVCAIAEKEKVETLILGAYGCGVFGNDPSRVGRYFLEALPLTHVRNVLFAVPGKGDVNHRKIREEVERYQQRARSGA